MAFARKNALFIVAAVCLMAVLLVAYNVAHDGDKKAAPKLSYSLIEGYGGTFPRPDAAEQPSLDKTYKVVFDVTSAINDTTAVHPGLGRVARAVNIFGDSGVPLDHLKFVAVIHGPATRTILDDKQYDKRAGGDNPNHGLIQALTDAGVKVIVCGQSLNHLGVEDSDIDKNVIIAPAALSTLAIYGNDGYAYEHL
ncbi:DsrE family protein [Larsenimonas rhizosphaerae]|uniref:DsrE family protein n=1 Tax=Larsenimonas rhizosphaerae TaxID=2944682 RepID=A0AA42CY40_9GAMM|nr:DsrE family protein [Larsenimonas rhizosphaerae]MCM2132045.1 DsrE family protein [Larsenimonas rhizosphaerae]MCX2524648.1 DsrE family protein [Larsenimonas rhizosphaerae]